MTYQRGIRGRRTVTLFLLKGKRGCSSNGGVEQGRVRGSITIRFGARRCTSEAPRLQENKIGEKAVLRRTRLELQGRRDRRRRTAEGKKREGGRRVVGVLI